MPHETALIGTIAAGLGLAFVFGLLASRLRLPPILGYLLAGVAVGPFTPGFVADSGLAAQLAELGVILLMFGVGLHFSIADLLAVRRIAVPGAVAQIAVATGLGAAVSHLWGWSWGTGLVFGLALSVASTVVLLKALEARGILDSSDGRIAVGWLVVEDLVTVLALVLLPALAPMLGGTAGGGAATGGLAATLGITLLKVSAFVAVMLVVGRRAIPWLLGRVVSTGSRELFTLAVLAVALGIAVGAATLFGVSFALGAFFAGVIVSESDFSHEAATNALPLQDAFAVLFFVSVGMLFDPAILVQRPLEVLAVVGIVTIGKSLASLAIVLGFRYPLHTALTISASLAQIGEFSFILIALGVSLGLVPPEAQGLVVAGALLSITLNPFVFGAVGPIDRWLRARPRLAAAFERPAGEITELPTSVDEDALADHVVLVGYGRVGAPVAKELARHAIPYVVVEQSRERAEDLREAGLPVIYGDATRPEVLADAHLERARLVVVAAPDAFQTRAILALARRLNPGVDVVVRTHSDEEREFLETHGAGRALVGERELAVSLTRYALRRFAVAHDMSEVAERALAGS
ncbi:YbaL family putative K(+) efflux transporter [Roseisolibacter sp. H3M3-2]|uniref:YbaL family putative K(+) efflux transporter n=1 Tax=Roseisolibacter sp. H3M3-2 TaxID=3031323 RepID=UPI0023DC63BE|nr:YbaL family putative K(+) efflux transporter [Roseisolibacter sp. H3M3-2]MDF1504766.1 YbaL family putative K(+) efflux transporter [Roseisolibacter sp. H3M3-2]